MLFTVTPALSLVLCFVTVAVWARTSQNNATLVETRQVVIDAGFGELDIYTRSSQYTIPLLLIVAGSAVEPLAWYVSRCSQQSRRRERLSGGFCAKCGYDRRRRERSARIWPAAPNAGRYRLNGRIGQPNF